MLRERTAALFDTTESSLFNDKESYVSLHYRINRIDTDINSTSEYVQTKFAKESKFSQELPTYLQDKIRAKTKKPAPKLEIEEEAEDSIIIRPQQQSSSGVVSNDGQLVLHEPTSVQHNASRSLIQRQQDQQFYIPEKPEWHAPWKLMRVIGGHKGWVRTLAVEPDNKWFASGSSDNTIKAWDLASGQLKLTLTGHVMAVRDIAISDRHPYMFSCGEDKTVKCWDLERNKVIRDYYGHLSGVYSLDIHPTLDVLVTGSRDSTVRVWDIRTSTGIMVLSGHKNPITNIKCQSTDPQIVSTSNDKTIRLWDLAAGKTQTVLTHHKKSIRALALHPTEYSFATASPDNIKQWKFPEGSFMQNFVPHREAIINTLSINQDNVLFSGGDNGSLSFYDWKSGHKFQEMETTRMPGSLESESGIYTSTFDKTGMRLITGEADKSIKIWRENPEATPESHPGIPFDPENYRQRY